MPLIIFTFFKPSKSWRSVQDHLIKKWSEIPNLSNRLSLYPCLPQGVPVPSPLINFLANLQQTVAQSLQNFPHYQLNPSEDGQIVPIYYHISAFSSSSSSSSAPSLKDQRSALISEDSLIKAIDNWNEYSIDSYLLKEKTGKATTNNMPPPPVPTFYPPLPATLSKLETLSTIAASAATLMENTHSNYSNMDHIMNSNTMHGLLQDLISDVADPQPSSSSVMKSETSRPPKEIINLEASESVPSVIISATVNKANPSPPKKLPGEKKEVEKNDEKKQKTKKGKNSKKKEALPSNPSSLPSVKLLQSPSNASKPSEFTNLLNSFASDITQPPLPSSTTNSASKSNLNTKLNTAAGKKTGKKSNEVDPSSLFLNHENSLYIKEMYADVDNDNYSKSNLSQSSVNRNFAHIFMLSEQSKEAKKNAEDKAIHLLNSLATSQSLYQSIINNTNSASAAPAQHSSPSNHQSTITAVCQKGVGSSTPLGAIFGAASPATVVTPISDAEVSNLGKISTIHPSTPPKPSNITQQPVTVMNPELSSPLATQRPVIPKTPLSTKKRKINGLQQKRLELLNEANEPHVLPQSQLLEHQRIEEEKRFMQPTSPQDLFSPMKAPRTIVANTPSKSLLMKDINDKTQLAVEQHVLTANIMSGMCHLPPGFSAPAKKVPTFIQNLSRVGRSRPELRRITPTFIGPLIKREEDHVVEQK